MTRIDSPQGSWKVLDGRQNPLRWDHTPIPGQSVGLTAYSSDMFPIWLAWRKSETYPVPAAAKHEDDGA